jgi:hypothetical protein
VTPSEPEVEGEEGAEEEVLVSEDGTDPVAEQAEETPVDPIETERYEAPELKDEAPPAATDPVDAVAEVLLVEEKQEDTAPAA